MKSKEQEKNTTQNNADVVDASHYIRVLAHDGQVFFTLWLDPDTIDTAQELGQGKYDESQPPVPVLRIKYKNGMVEDVLDKWQEATKYADAKKTEV